MNFAAAESAKNTWSSIFRRRGANGVYTRLFDSLDCEHQHALITAAELELRENELPVIGSIRDAQNWLILTTDRLLWCIEGRRMELSIEYIRDVGADLGELQRKQQSKLEMRQIRILTLTNLTYPIELEPGPPLSGTWNVLRNIGARNRRSTERPR